MLVTCQQMQSAEQAAFDRGVSAEELMELAGKGIADVVRQFFPKPGIAILYLGKGNNAGDALVAGRELEKYGWQVRAVCAFLKSDFKELPMKHWKALNLGKRDFDSLRESECRSPFIQLDGLLGIGASGPLRGTLFSSARMMNTLRHIQHATTIALDIPSGLDADTGEPCADCVEADITVTIGAVNAGLVADAATNYVGRLALVKLPEITFAEGDRRAAILTAGKLSAMLPRRAFDFHKGQAGRVGIIAGSLEFSGAGVLAATGALRGGAGLVTLFVKENARQLIAAKCPPEIMVRAVSDYREALEMKLDALAIGPGIGFAAREEIADIIRDAITPVVIDADALTILAEEKLAPLLKARGPRLLTPHPGEMSRLVAGRDDWSIKNRRELARAFVAKNKCATLLLKGARTVIAQSGKQTRFNTTGHPGMATGGMGDVLAGLCAALIGQGMSCFDGASLGAWLCGRAAEIVIANGAQSAESLAASDVAAHLGAAFEDVRRGVW